MYLLSLLHQQCCACCMGHTAWGCCAFLCTWMLRICASRSDVCCAAGSAGGGTVLSCCGYQGTGYPVSIALHTVWMVGGDARMHAYTLFLSLSLSLRSRISRVAHGACGVASLYSAYLRYPSSSLCLYPIGATAGGWWFLPTRRDAILLPKGEISDFPFKETYPTRARARKPVWRGQTGYVGGKERDDRRRRADSNAMRQTRQTYFVPHTHKIVAQCVQAV